MSNVSAAPHTGSAERAPRGLRRALRFAQHATSLAGFEIRKLGRDPTELFTRAIQPTLWLVVFGQVFARVRGIETGVPYLDFLAPGVLAQSVLFAAIFYGISVIWERDLGLVHKLLVSPADRSALVVGKALSAGVRGLIQALIVYLLAGVLGIGVRLDPLAVLSVAAVVVLGSAVFATFSLIVACVVKTRERFMGIGQVLTMPMFFASNAIYPISLMPGWLQAVAHINPLTYLVDALRAMMIVNGTSHFGLAIDLLVLLVGLVAMVLVAARLYPSLVQ
ncbi:MAG: ABC transporter permease [Planctomycetota bacterium]